jgi:hypothetical protein
VVRIERNDEASQRADRPRSAASEREQLIQAGRAAARDGSLRDAIAAYSHANRLARDSIIERTLLALRREAGTQSSSGARPDWPPPIEDPFPRTDGLPEIAREDLNRDRLGGGILNHGAVLIRRFADTSSASALRDGIDQALAAAADPARSDPALGWHDCFESDKSELAVGRALTAGLGGGLLAVDSPRAFFLFAELVSTVGFVDVVADYLGERPLLSADKTTFRRLREAPAPAWHQDGSFMGNVRAVNLWLALSHCGDGADARGLDVIPRRMDDLLPTGTDGVPDAVASIGEAMVDRKVATATLTPEFEPGDALCFDEWFLHRTSAIEASGDRYAIEAWFFAPSHFPAQYTPIVI